MEKFSFRFAVYAEAVHLVLSALVFALALWGLTPHTVFWYVVLVLLGGVYLFFAVFYIPMYAVNWSLTVTEESIILTSGVFVVRTRHQLRSQISMATVYDNPFSGLLSVSTLVLYAPGSTVVIPLLDRKRAYAIARQLQK